MGNIQVLRMVRKRVRMRTSAYTDGCMFIFHMGMPTDDDKSIITNLHLKGGS